MAAREHGTLVAATVSTVTITGSHEDILVLNHGSDAIYFTVNGDTPTVAGDDTFVALGGGYAYAEARGAGPYSVKLISSGTPAYSVMGEGR